MSTYTVICKIEKIIIGTFSNYEKAAKVADEHEQSGHSCKIEVNQ